MIGFFGFAEVFTQFERGDRVSVTQRVRGVWASLGEIRGNVAALLRSSVIGTAIGILPGTGATIASITAYGVAKRVSRGGIAYGAGNPTGVIAAESANNASVGGALVPMLSLGIPGDPMTAVLIGALMIHGLAPGPRLFVDRPEFVSSIFVAYMVATIMMMVVGLAAARPFARLLTFPRTVVLPFIGLLCFTGSYTIQGSVFDVGVAVAAGFAGYLLRKVDVHPAPIVLGIVLGPLFENNLRRSILLGEGDLTPFLTRPFSLVIVLAIVAVLLGPTLYRLAGPPPRPPAPGRSGEAA
jgi:putative tricarboxylic transport membrane protein